MKIFATNQLALLPQSLELIGEFRQIAEQVLDESFFSGNSNRSPRKDFLDAMNKIGSEKMKETHARQRRAEQREKRRAFDKQIKSHWRASFQFALRLTGDPDTAEELVQETMLRAVRGWASFRKNSQFQTWLFRILINVFRDRIRQSEHREPEIEATSDCPSRAPCVESQLEARELGQIANQLVSQLPPRQREVLILATYHSMTTKQIAETLDITPANVHANLSMARKRLKQQFSPYLDLQ